MAWFVQKRCETKFQVKVSSRVVNCIDFDPSNADLFSETFGTAQCVQQEEFSQAATLSCPVNR